MAARFTLTLLAPSSAAWQTLPGGNPGAFGTTSTAKFYDGVGGTTQLTPFLTPTYKLNGVSVSCGNGVADRLEHSFGDDHQPRRSALVHRSRTRWWP